MSLTINSDPSLCHKTGLLVVEIGISFLLGVDGSVLGIPAFDHLAVCIIANPFSFSPVNTFDEKSAKSFGSALCIGSRTLCCKHIGISSEFIIILEDIRDTYFLGSSLCTITYHIKPIPGFGSHVTDFSASGCSVKPKVLLIALHTLSCIILIPIRKACLLIGNKHTIVRAVRILPGWLSSK